MLSIGAGNYGLYEKKLVLVVSIILKYFFGEGVSYFKLRWVLESCSKTLDC